MTIDIYSEEYKDQDLNPIFNGGMAGVVKGCAARVEKKTDKDPDNFPKYRIVYIDEKGGEINKGYFDNYDEASDKAKKYFVKEMRHLLDQSGTKLATKANSYSELLDAAMKELYKAMPKNKYNLAVSFGTESYPKSFLEINGYWGILNVDSDRLPNVSKDALRERPAPDNDLINSGDKEEVDDLPFGNEETTTFEEDNNDW